MIRSLVVVAVFVAVNASGFVVYREVHTATVEPTLARPPATSQPKPSEPATPALEPAKPAIAPAPTASPPPPSSPSPTETPTTTAPDRSVSEHTEIPPAAPPAPTVRAATVRPHTNESAIRTAPKKPAAAITKSADEAPVVKASEPVKVPAPEKDKVLEMEGNPYKRGE